MDSSNQFLVVLFMALCPEDLSSIKVGKLSPYTYATTPNPPPLSFSSSPTGGLHTHDAHEEPPPPRGMVAGG